MEQTLLVKIFTPSDIILECNALSATMPGEKGVFGVLPNHSLLIANLQIGVMQILETKNNLQYFIYGGIAQVRGNEVNIITDFAIDIAKIQKTEVMEKITIFKQEIERDANKAEINLMSEDLTKYESLLTFMN